MHACMFAVSSPYRGQLFPLPIMACCLAVIALLVLFDPLAGDPHVFQRLLKQGFVLEAVSEGLQDVARVNRSHRENAKLKQSLWQSVAKAARMARLHDTALLLHQDVLQWAKTSGDSNKVLKACFEVATDHFRLGRAQKGLDAIDNCQQHVSDSLNPLSRGLLHRVRALAYDCMGRPKDALHASKQGTEWSILSPFPKAALTQELTRHLLYMQRAAFSPFGKARFDTSTAADSSTANADVRAKLMAIGGYKHPYQLPQQYDDSLPAEAWPDAHNYPSLRKLMQRLEDSASALRAEGLRLYHQQRYFQDEHCIPARQRGRWSRFEASGVWEDRDANGCSLDSPVLCQLVHDALKQTPELVITRASYSHVEPNTWIQPHYGHSNRRLKLHLGLVVPFAQDLKAEIPDRFRQEHHESCHDKCAFFRIGQGDHAVRCWDNATVLLLDDSFEHEVLNACKQERLVLQIMIKHPLLCDSVNDGKLPPVTTS
eukprot:TRINITY_DN10737_c0_g1_i1.p1 TRINITY_DN10737_c0_g1~~TRINITY_DN10737_c0_g1_i1.p1  ORF type:complete len:485 (+),score=85.92 TRINITY_DN10737_c0_g1_i1:1179-2633(+)